MTDKLHLIGGLIAIGVGITIMILVRDMWFGALGAILTFCGMAIAIISIYRIRRGLE